MSRSGKPSREWLEYEIKLILKLWNVCSVSEIAKYLNSTEAQVRYIAKKKLLTSRQRKQQMKSTDKKLLDYHVNRYLDSFGAELLPSDIFSHEVEIAPPPPKKPRKKPIKKHSTSNATKTITDNTKPRYKQSSTLCWDCANATGAGDCEWVEAFKPVPGWEALYRPMKQRADGTIRTIESYRVIKCPKFIPDPPRKR